MPNELNQAQALAFDNELRKIKKEVLKQDVPALETFELFDTETDVPVGMLEYGVDMLTQSGDVNVITGETDDIRYAEVGIYRTTNKIISLGNGYRWDYLEALALANTGKVPRRLRGAAARDVMLIRQNEIGMTGLARYGVHGVLTFPGVPRHQMATQLAYTDSAEDMLADLFDLYMRPVRATKNVQKPTHLTLPLDKYINVSTKARSTTTDTTVLQFFKEQVKGLLGKDPIVRGSYMLDEQDKAIVHTKGQPNHAKLVIPGGMLWQQLPVQAHNYGFKVPCLGNTGGWYTAYPQRMVIGEFQAS